MPFSVQGNVKHSRTRAILVRTHYFTKKNPILPFPSDFQLLQTSPGTEKMEALPLKVSNFSLAFSRNQSYAAHTCSSRDFPQELLVHCNCCIF